MRKKIPNQKIKVERLQYESLINETIFRNLYNQQVYFVDTDLKSKNYFKLGFSPEMILTAGKNLIRIQGKPGMLAPNSQLLIEAVDRTGLPLKTSIYDLKNETSDKVISIEIHEATPPGDVRLTLVGSALRDPNGNVVPPAWQNEMNFKWSQTFEARPFTANRSDILFNEETTPVITISEVIKPWNKLTYNQELVTPMGGSSSPNITSKFKLQTNNNTRSKVSYRKSGGHYFITAHAFDNNILDFGGFTEDMVGGILIVAEPINPRPRSVAGYDAPQIYSPKENGDGFKIIVNVTASDGSAVTMSSGTCWADEDEDNAQHEIFIAGAYQTTVLEFISPWEIRVKDPHTTWQGLKEKTHRLFEHTEFQASAYRLIWNQKPQSCDPTPINDEGIVMKNSFAHVKLTNLTPASGDVTRVKSYTRNNQSPADWQLASDMTVNAKEMLYCEQETCTTPAGDFSRWGLGDEGIIGVLPYWDTIGKGTIDPTLSLYYQQGADDAPPTPDSLVVGSNVSSSYLTGDNHWILYSKLFPNFKKGKMYQLEISSVSTKTQPTSWLPDAGDVGDPSIEIYLSGSSFIDDINDQYTYGKKVGSIQTAADKEKHVEQDRYNKDLTKGYKFLFVADEDGTGKPLIKINSGLWQFWNISLKPLDLFGFTPEEFEITFPTNKTDVKESEAIDFKFEFYNDYGTIANYTAELNNITWENEHTAVFDNIVVNKLYADFLISTASVTNLAPVTFSAGIFVAGDTTIGTHATQSLTLDAAVKFPNMSLFDGRIVTYNQSTQQLGYSDTSSFYAGSGNAPAIQHSWMTVRTGFNKPYASANGVNQVLDITGNYQSIKTITGSVNGNASIIITQETNPTFTGTVTALDALSSPTSSDFSGSVSMSGKIDIGTCCTDDITIRGDIKLRCLNYWDQPKQVLSYDYDTRTVYYSDMPTGGSGGGGGCETGYSRIGYATNVAWSEGGPTPHFTASSCNDIFYLLPGTGITMAHSPMGVNNTDDGLVISATRQDKGWYAISADNSTYGMTLGFDETLFITGSGGIVVEAGYSQSGGSSVVVVEVDGSGISSGVSSISSTDGTDSIGEAITVNTNALGAVTVDVFAYDGGTNVGYVPSGSGNNGKLFLNGLGNWSPPPANTNTTYDLNGIGTNNGTAKISLSGSNGVVDDISITGNQQINVTHSADTIAIEHGDVARTDTATSLNPTHGSSFETVDEIITDSQGHITEVTTNTITLPAAGAGLVTSLTTTGTSGASTLINGVLNIPTGSSGIVQTVNGFGTSGLTVPIIASIGGSQMDIGLNRFGGTNKVGYVPSSIASSQTAAYLRADGQWAEPAASGGGNAGSFATSFKFNAYQKNMFLGYHSFTNMTLGSGWSPGDVTSIVQLSTAGNNPTTWTSVELLGATVFNNALQATTHGPCDSTSLVSNLCKAQVTMTGDSEYDYTISLWKWDPCGADAVVLVEETVAKTTGPGNVICQSFDFITNPTDEKSFTGTECLALAVTSGVNATTTCQARVDLRWTYTAVDPTP